MLLRLDRLLCECDGRLTRKQAKDLLRSGAVTIDGVVCKQGDRKVDPSVSEVAVSGRVCSYAENHYFVLHKPSGVITATEDTRQKTVLDLLGEDKKKNLFPVGRLDIDTEGLLIITDDGPLGHALTSPAKHVKKTYLATCTGVFTETELAKLRNGVDLGDFTSAPAQAQILETGDLTTVLAITITEGRFHQVKRMVAAVGGEVTKLKRVRMGGLWLPNDLPVGEHREYEREELLALLRQDETIDEERLLRSYL
ncbi:MAG: rRNA pseudouridine synthase [Lachnospiraceae bacterium]|nr:rRNA pseudouridine synthase [Lachnospiraceae bacterium]